MMMNFSRKIGFNVFIFQLLTVILVLSNVAFGMSQDKFQKVGLLDEEVYLIYNPANQKYGVTDERGKIIVKPRYNFIWPYSEGWACVQLGDKYGYIDANGKVVVNPQYEEAIYLCHGLAGVKVNKRFGYIDRNGKMVIEPQFDSVRNHIQGMARIKIDGKYGYIDEKGEMIIPAVFDMAWDFNNYGLALVGKDGKWGCVDKQGKMVVPLRFDDFNGFIDGRAIVVIDGKYGYVDTEGRIVIKPQFENAWFFNEGLAMIELGGRRGYIDKNGDIVIKPQFDWAANFREGYAAIKIEDSYGFVNKDGKTFIRPNWRNACSFNEGLAAVWIGEINDDFKDYKYCFIDRKMQTIIAPKVELCFTRFFCGGMALIYNGHNFGFMNKAGKIVVPPIYRQARDFHDGMALVEKDNRWFYINHKGNLVKGPFYSNLGNQDEFLSSYTAVQLDGKWGFMDDDDGIWIKPQFDEIKKFTINTENQLALVQVNGHWGLVDLFGEMRLAPKFDSIECKIEIAQGVIDDRISVIDKSGHIIKMPDCDEIIDLFNGQIAYRFNEKWGVCDHKGKILIEPLYDEIKPIYGCSLKSCRFKDKWGIIDKNGRITIKPRFDECPNIVDFYVRINGWYRSSEFIKAKINDKYGVVDLHGNVIAPFCYDDIDENGFGSLEVGLVKVVIDQKSGFINKFGKQVIPPLFDRFSDFQNGIARVWFNDNVSCLIEHTGSIVLKLTSGVVLKGVLKNGQWGVVNQKNQTIIEPKFEAIAGFANDLARVQINGQWRILNLRNMATSGCSYDLIGDLADGLAPVKIKDKWGFIEKNCKVFIKPKFNDVIPFGKKLFCVKVGELWGIMNTKGCFVIKPRFDAVMVENELRATVQTGYEQKQLLVHIDSNGQLRIEEK
jgi:hypothetical protein